MWIVGIAFFADAATAYADNDDGDTNATADADADDAVDKGLCRR
jgi:hypothetical protein